MSFEITYEKSIKLIREVVNLFPEKYDEKKLKEALYALPFTPLKFFIELGSYFGIIEKFLLKNLLEMRIEEFPNFINDFLSTYINTIGKEHKGKKLGEILEKCIEYVMEDEFI